MSYRPLARFFGAAPSGAFHASEYAKKSSANRAPDPATHNKSENQLALLKLISPWSDLCLRGRERTVIDDPGGRMGARRLPVARRGDYRRHCDDARRGRNSHGVAGNIIIIGDGYYTGKVTPRKLVGHLRGRSWHERDAFAGRPKNVLVVPVVSSFVWIAAACCCALRRRRQQRRLSGKGV